MASEQAHTGDDGFTTSQLVLFVEKDEVMGLLAKLADAIPPDQEDQLRTYERLCSILERYQEQSHLLDSHLEEMMGVIMDRASRIVTDREAQVLASTQGEAGAQAFPFQVYSNPQLHVLFQAIYQLCRVRGAKTVVKLLTHEAQDLEPVLHMLQSQDRGDYQQWETRYGLLLWLSMLSLVPFDICTIDSTLGGAGGAGGESTLVSDIIALGKQYLADTGPTRDAAAMCLSTLLTRPDMEQRHLAEFMQWAGTVLATRVTAGHSADIDLSARTFLVAGVMSTLVALFKLGHREKLIGLVPLVFEHTVAIAEQGSNQTLLRKMLVKLFQRIGMTFLPPRVLSWRYQRGQRSLLQNLANAGTDPAGAAPDGSGGSADGRADGAADEEDHGAGDEEDQPDVPGELEDVVEQLLCGLRDRDTVVRWSAAKGVGRIAGRLPRELTDDVVESVLALFSDAEGDGAWHGGCLALAELSRRGLLLPSRLPQAVPVVCRAILYDVRRGQTSTGSHVRDAACYMCWAFARAYSPEVLRPFVPKLCSGMLVTALFDREINVRRAAAAAFQENVGRQGDQNFQHGIEVLTAADYFTLGNRANAYLAISVFVAQFERYRHDIIDHLWKVKLAHWDRDVRTLSARALRNLTKLEPAYMAKEVLPDLLERSLSPDLLKRHGACLASAELVLALAECSYKLDSPTVLEDLTELIPRVEKARLYRGRGGEMMKAAACRLVECMAMAGVALPIKKQLRLLDSLDDCLRHPVEEVQIAAGQSLRRFLRAYMPVGASGPSERMRARTIEKYTLGLQTDDNPAVTRGLALALGALPRKLAGASADTLTLVLETLAKAADPATSVGEQPDAETRRNAVHALVQVCEEVGMGTGGVGQPGGTPASLGMADVNLVFKALLKAAEDYSMDNRGDVGSWCRMAALQAIQRLIILSVDASTGLPIENRGGRLGQPTSAKIPEAEELERLLHWGQRLPVQTDYGPGEVTGCLAGEAVVEVTFQPPAPGYSHFEPKGVGFLPRDQLRTGTLEETDFVVPSLEERTAALSAYQPPTPPATTPANCCSEVYFTPEMCESAVCACLKQLSEKLDAVREVAGNVLASVLNCDRPRIPYVPERKMLELALSPPSGPGGDPVNWASPGVTFPMMVRAMSLAPFHDSIVAGLVISVGGLTESVVKHSSAALLQWCRAAKKAKNRRALAGLATALIGLFDKHAGEDRVIPPLLKTLDLLLSNDVFEGLQPEDHPFAEDLLQCLKGVLHRCRDMQRLLGCGGVLLGLLSYPEPIRPQVLQVLVLLLGHRFPRVRKAVAEQMYIRLLALEEAVPADSYDDLLETLTCVVWDSDVETACRGRNHIARLVGVTVPQSKKAATGRPRPKADNDGAGSYAALVHSVGY